MGLLICILEDSLVSPSSCSKVAINSSEGLDSDLDDCGREGGRVGEGSSGEDRVEVRLRWEALKTELIKDFWQSCGDSLPYKGMGHRNLPLGCH